MEKRKRSSQILFVVAAICFILWLFPTVRHENLPGAKKNVTVVSIGLWFSPWLVWSNTNRTDGLGIEQLTELVIYSWSWVLLIGANVALWARRRVQVKQENIHMDWVTLTKEQVEIDALPPVCMSCGKPATCRVNQSFSHTPPWVEWLYWAGIIPGVIASHYLKKEMRVSCPFCNKHRYHWQSQYWVAGIGWLAIGLPFAGVGYIIGIALGMGGNIPYFGLGIGGAIGLVVWLGFVIYLESTRIRAKKVTGIDISFERVHEAFVQAVRNHKYAQ